MSRPSFLALPRPIVTCILGEKTVEDAIATVKNGEFKGAPAFAIHLEKLAKEDLTDDNLRRIAGCTRRPFMFLHYRGDGRFTDEERVELLTRAIECGAACDDFTADTFDPSPMEFTEKSEAVDRQKRAIDRVHELGGEVVMSSHILDRARSCEQVLAHLQAVEARGADFAKIVTMANTEEEFVEAVRTTMVLRRELKKPFIFLCGGKFALPMRYLCPSLGNALTFCVEKYSAAFTTGQPPLENMQRILKSYNWHINECD